MKETIFNLFSFHWKKLFERILPKCLIYPPYSIEKPLNRPNSICLSKIHPVVELFELVFWLAVYTIQLSFPNRLFDFRCCGPLIKFRPAKGHIVSEEIKSKT